MNIAGQEKLVTISGSGPYSLGTFSIVVPGYQKLELTGIERSGPTYIDMTNVIVKCAGALLFIPPGDALSIYWGRRAPAGSLWYKEFLQLKNVDYFYTELHVPVGTDTVGSYFMADGFKRGYFGMQVNTKTERRVIFSVWSPYKTDHF